MGHIID